MRIRRPAAGQRNLLSGLADAGFASLGTFIAGIVAVRELSSASLALYVVLSSAAVFAMPLPRQLAYYPAALSANLVREPVSPVVRHSVAAARRSSLIAVAVVLIAGATLARTVPLPELLALTVSAAVFVVLSPLQDHIRGALHVAARHSRAAACSVVLAAAIAITLLVSVLVPLPPAGVALLPFGSLVVGNAASIVVGVLLLRGVPRHVAYQRRAFIERSRYLLIELITQGAWLACNYVILFTLGAEALASLETARISASPVLILASGVSTFMVAALLRQISADTQDPARARQLLLRAFAIVLVGAAGWAVVLTVARPSIDSALNRSIDMGLAFTRIAAFALDGCSSLVGAVLLAIGSSKSALVTSAGAAVIGLAGTAVLAPFLGPIALPVAQGGGMATRLAVSLGISRDRFRS